MRKTSNFLLPVLLLLISISLTPSAGAQTFEQSRCKPDLGAEEAAKKASFNSSSEPIAARFGKDIRVGDPAYGDTIQACISAIGANKVALRVPAGTHNFFADFTIPSNITLIPERGAILTRTGGNHLDINGPFVAGLWHCFSDTSTTHDWVKFGKESVSQVYPQWWGAVGDDATDCTAPINAALAAHPLVRITHGIFKTTNILKVARNGTLCGDGPSSVVHMSIRGPGIYPANYATIKNFTLRGTYTPQPGGWAISALYHNADPGADPHRTMNDTDWTGTHLLVEDMVIEDFGGGGICPGPYSIIRFCTIQHCLGEGILLLGDSCQVYSNRIETVPSWGIDINSSYNAVTKNKLYNCGNYKILGSYDGGGIVLLSGPIAPGIKENNVSFNSIFCSDMPAVVVAATNEYTLTDCQINDNVISEVCKNFNEPVGAISLYDDNKKPGALRVERISICRNHILSAGGATTAYGIMLRAVKEIKVNGNIISGVANHAIYIKDHLAGRPVDIQISNNRIESLSKNAISINGADRVSLDNNTISNPAAH
jgi:hypothetical protein